jgi:hypothetical protein
MEEKSVVYVKVVIPVFASKNWGEGKFSNP